MNTCITNMDTNKANTDGNGGSCVAYYKSVWLQRVEWDLATQQQYTLLAYTGFTKV